MCTVNVNAGVRPYLLSYPLPNGDLQPSAGTGDWATIIQHPEGRDKQISLRNNEIIDLTLPDLVDKSDLVVVGIPKSRVSRWEGGRIITYTTVAVDQAVGGDAKAGGIGLADSVYKSLIAHQEARQ